MSTFTHAAEIPASPEFEAIARGAQFRDLVAIRVNASPEEIFEAARQVTLSEMTLARVVGELRYLPSRLAGHSPSSDPDRPFLRILIEGGTLVLRDDSPREIITGSAAQLHRIVDQAPLRFGTREEFDDFDDPNHEKSFASRRREIPPSGGSCSNTRRGPCRRKPDGSSPDTGASSNRAERSSACSC